MQETLWVCLFAASICCPERYHRKCCLPHYSSSCEVKTFLKALSRLHSSFVSHSCCWGLGYNMSYQEWCDVFILLCCTFCCESYLWFKTSKFPFKQVVFIWEIHIWTQQVLASRLFIILLLSYLTKLQCWRLYGVFVFGYHLASLVDCYQITYSFNILCMICEFLLKKCLRRAGCFLDDCYQCLNLSPWDSRDFCWHMSVISCR